MSQKHDKALEDYRIFQLGYNAALADHVDVGEGRRARREKLALLTVLEVLITVLPADDFVRRGQLANHHTALTGDLNAAPQKGGCGCQESP